MENRKVYVQCANEMTVKKATNKEDNTILQSASHKSGEKFYYEREVTFTLYNDPLELTGAFVRGLIDTLKMHKVPVERMNLNKKG